MSKNIQIIIVVFIKIVIDYYSLGFLILPIYSNLITTIVAWFTVLKIINIKIAIYKQIIIVVFLILYSNVQLVIFDENPKALINLIFLLVVFVQLMPLLIFIDCIKQIINRVVISFIICLAILVIYYFILKITDNIGLNLISLTYNSIISSLSLLLYFLNINKFKNIFSRER